MDDPQGPIEHFSWGKYVICGIEHSASEKGQTGAGKDIRLIGREATAWREREGHQLSAEMITGIYDQGIEVLVIGTGVNGAIVCPEEVVGQIQARGIAQVILARTPEACATYNVLFHQHKRVALLAHATC